MPFLKSKTMTFLKSRANRIPFLKSIEFANAIPFLKSKAISLGMETTMFRLAQATEISDPIVEFVSVDVMNQISERDRSMGYRVDQTLSRD